MQDEIKKLDENLRYNIDLKSFSVNKHSNN